MKEHYWLVVVSTAVIDFFVVLLCPVPRKIVEDSSYWMHLKKLVVVKGAGAHFCKMKPLFNFLFCF